MLLPSLSAAERFVTNESNGFTWIQQGKAYPILVDSQEDKGVLRAVANLQTDAGKVTGATPEIIHSPSGNRILIVGSVENSSWIKQLVQAGKIPAADLKGKREKYILQTVKQPVEGVEEAIVIAGSDKRGTIYGIYELSRQMHQRTLYLLIGSVLCLWACNYYNVQTVFKFRFIQPITFSYQSGESVANHTIPYFFTY